MAEPFASLQAALADRYRIERELGRGGMATVFLAEDLKHRRKVAVKVLRPELTAALGPERFLREIDTVARLNHPHILPLHDSGEVEGFLYYVMPFVEGESLRNRLSREGQLPLSEALTVAREVADALDYAHRAGVIHRDIKPENILFQAGHALVTDFGISRAVRAAGGENLTEPGLAVGTPTYMSPEQATGVPTLDVRTDIYSLGAVLYEMLAGEPPYSGPTPQAIISKLLAERPARLRTIRVAIPEGVEQTVMKALEKVPADRFMSAAEFAEALSSPLAICPSCSQPVPHGASFCTRCGAPIDTHIGPAVNSRNAEADHRARLQRALGAPYRLHELIGRGGYGMVYSAWDVRLERQVAVKTIRQDVLAGPELLTRFIREARAVAQLRHPHIIPIYDVGGAEGVVYIIMPRIQGGSLRTLLQREAVPVAEAIRLLVEAASAFEAAHAAGFVHRDVKPDNILLDGPQRHVMLTDFGLTKALHGDEATLTGAGVVLGTPAYLSPEQAAGEAVIDHRADIYSLGVMGYELLAGRRPFVGSSHEELIAQHIASPAPDLREFRPEVSPALALVIMRCLEKAPDNRWGSAGQFAAALQATTMSEESTLVRVAPPAASTLRPVPAGEPAAPTPPVTSIAVLPFLFLSEVEASQALSLGFADALITILGSLEDVVVLPTSAILKYAPGTDAARACRDLGVRHILQGNIQKAGAHWRVSIQLFDAETQRMVLSENQDFQRDSVFEVQDEIGRRVVVSLNSRFLLAPPKSRDRYSSDPEAYDQFMSGLRESYADQPETLERAIGHLSVAVERDPGFALAHAWLSYVSMNMHFSFDPQRTRLETAEHHCRQALVLDPALPEGHLARAWILWSPARNFQHAEAIAALEEVLAARPNLEQAHNRKAAICLHIGRLQEARVAHERAQRSNPKTRSLNLEFCYVYSGDFARAEEALAALVRERPGTMYALYAHAYVPLLAGDLDLAEQRLAAALRQLADEPLIVSLQGLLHARRNQTDLALQCVRRALDSPRSFGHNHHTYYQVAGVYAVLGETDKAMAWLERTVEAGFACWPFFRVDPHLASLRDEPAFERLVADLERKFTAIEIRRL